MKYQKKPVVVEAVQYDGNLSSVKKFIDHKVDYEFSKGNFNILTLEGRLHVSDGDYIIKGVHGEFYPCKPDIFEETYEPSGRSVDGKLLAEKLAVPIKHELDKRSRGAQRRKGFL